MKNNILKENRFYWIYLTGFFIILALPLLNWPIYFSPPNWAKTFVFQIVFSIILFTFLCQAIWSGRLSPTKQLYPIRRENLLFWLLLALFAANLLATIFSVDFSHSFFGSPYRGGGFINYGFYILFAIALFLIVRKKDWQKLWGFAIFIGGIVCLLALLSRLGLFSDFIIRRIDNISSTIGGPNTLALYLLLLVFPTLGFGIATKNTLKRALYLSAFALFCFILILTISQGAYLGLAAGIAYFFFFYPVRSKMPVASADTASHWTSNGVNPTKNLPEGKSKKILYIKLTLVILMFLVVAGVLFIKSNPEISINKNYLFRNLTEWRIDQSRLSAWQVSFNAFLNRPLLGYGLENFSVGFDRHYKPLVNIRMELGSPASWWDKAHNFALNMLVETGIVGFMSFALFFGLLFFKLNSITNQKPVKEEIKTGDNAIHPIIAHGLQTALVAYFANLMFNFENFSSYILVFLIAGYAMNLIIKEEPWQNQKAAKSYRLLQFLFKSRKIIAGGAFLLLVSFIWFFNIKPFNANAQINKAMYLATNKMCDPAVNIMEKEMKKRSIIDGYLRIQYIEILKQCVQADPENDAKYARIAIAALQENVNIMPFYTRNWLSLSSFNNINVVAEKDIERRRELINQSMGYLARAENLSPNRQEIFAERLNLYFYGEDYDSLAKTSQECIDESPNFTACYWYLGLAKIYQSKDKATLDEGKKYVEKAQEMGYIYFSPYPLTQLAFLFLKMENYQELEWVYERLSQYGIPRPKYFAGLAIVYKKNGKLEKSANALKSILAIQLDPVNIREGWIETDKTITLLLESILGVKESNPEYHLTLHRLYLEMAQAEEDPEKSATYQKKAEEELVLSSKS